MTSLGNIMEQVAQNNEVLFKLLDSQSEATILADKSGSLLYLNTLAQDNIQIKPSQLSAYSVFDIWPRLQPPDWKKWWSDPSHSQVENNIILTSKGMKVPVKMRRECLNDIYPKPVIKISFQLIDQRKDINEVLRKITEATSPVIGGDFFRSLALHLTSCLNIHYALITECANAAKNRVRTLVFIERDNVLENFEYDLSGTPCEIVMEGQGYYCEAELQSYFPKEIGIQSYYGVPIFFSTGEIAGHIAIFDTVPMTISQKETDILTIFASRAGAEIERKHKDETLAEDKARFESLFEESPIALWEADFSEAFNYLKQNKLDSGTGALEFKKSEDKLRDCLSKVLNLGLNKAFLRLFKTETEEEFLTQQALLFSPNLLTLFAEALLSFLAGSSKFAAEGTARTSEDEEIHLATQWTIPPGYASDASKVIISLVDVTKAKQAEQQLRDTLDELVVLKERLQQENVYLQEEIKLQHNFEEIVTGSESFRKVLQQVEQVAATDATVLILGESGTGKELISRAIHSISNRNHRPLVKVNCATLPATLIESELFGHEKGAFTGAFNQKIGRFELADEGTIFLDEVGELPLELQSKLLRVLQEGEFERLGSCKTKKVNVRVIAATNRDLQTGIKEGTFREDLYYRLDVFPITCPPLRDRKEDVPLLVKHFCKKFEPKIGKSIQRVPPKVMRALMGYSWPGNIRELENIIERGIILSQNGSLDLEDWLVSRSKEVATGASFRTLQEVERHHILDTLDKTHWKVSGENGAAKILGLKPTTLEARMKKLNIQRNK